MPFLEAIRLALQQIWVQKLKSFFTLLGVILTVLTCVSLFFVHVIRGEQAQIESDNNPPPSNPPQV